MKNPNEAERNVMKFAAFAAAHDNNYRLCERAKAWLVVWSYKVNSYQLREYWTIDSAVQAYREWFKFHVSFLPVIPIGVIGAFGTPAAGIILIQRHWEDEPTRKFSALPLLNVSE